MWVIKDPETYLNYFKDLNITSQVNKIQVNIINQDNGKLWKLTVCLISTPRLQTAQHSVLKAVFNNRSSHGSGIIFPSIISCLFILTSLTN